MDLKTEAKKIFSAQEAKDWITSFIVAAVFYFIIMPAILGTSSPAVVVSSCSEKGYLNIGDILVLQGSDIRTVSVPEVGQERLSFHPVVENGRVDALNFSGTVIRANDSNDIVVYGAFPSGYQIIHRALARVKTPDGYFLFTKGDANPIPDQITISGQPCVDTNLGCISTPITQRMLVGKKALFPVPLLGHVKLFFCDATLGILCEGHANAGTGGQYKLWC